jgi:aspartyl/asparaginyl-tRNA synthetase
MLKWIKKIPLESVVLVEGTLKKAPEPVRNCVIKELEILVSRVSSLNSVYDEWDANGLLLEFSFM